MITKEQFENGYTYSEYRKLVDDSFALGKTTGPEQSESRLAYTELNFHRMKRLDKTFELEPEVKEQISKMPCKVNWLLIAEAWCADAAQNAPVLHRLAEASKNIKFRIILRDENLDIMDQYLTDGGRAIPKLIIMDEKMNEIGTWGPRPKIVQDMVIENKRSENMPYIEFSKVVQKWYVQDKGRSLQREMLEIIEQVHCELDQ